MLALKLVSDLCFIQAKQFFLSLRKNSHLTENIECFRDVYSKPIHQKDKKRTVIYHYVCLKIGYIPKNDQKSYYHHLYWGKLYGVFNHGIYPLVICQNSY